MELKFILEAILFHAQKPLSITDIRDLLATAASESPEDPQPKAFKKSKPEEIAELLETLAKEHEAAARSYRLVCVAGSWQFVSQPEYAPWLRAIYGIKPRLPRLSQPGLETLAIIAYRQPITRTEIEQIRGVSVDGVMQTLLERGLVVAVGRAEVVGRPITYGTTNGFLEHFGLRSLEELPAADELRRIEVKKPEALLTIEPGLATAPPESLSAAPENAPDGSPTSSAGSESAPGATDSSASTGAANEKSAEVAPEAPSDDSAAGDQPAEPAADSHPSGPASESGPPASGEPASV